MNQANAMNDIKLNDVMLTMDIADTMRHSRLLVERELNADMRDQEMIDKVRSIYESQGIEVTDEIIEEAVAAIRDKRFAYRQAPSGLRTRLWHIYVKRGRWIKKVGVWFAAVLAAWGIHYGVVTIPQTKELNYQITQINQGIVDAKSGVSVQSERLARIRALLKGEKRQYPVTLQDTADGIRRDVVSDLQKAEGLLASAAEFSQKADLKPGNFVEKKKPASDRLQQQQSLLEKANNKITVAEEQILLLQRLDQVPQELKQLREHIKSVSAVPAATALSDDYYDEGFAALRSRDGQKIQKAIGKMKALLATIQSEYSLRVVSQPGQPSGVWRSPDANSNARNYYLIVEAITPEGERLSVPVVSEEDGKTRNAAMWGVRVSAVDYQRIAADKQDNGIIERNLVATKKRGYMEPDYQINTTGGAITQW